MITKTQLLNEIANELSVEYKGMTKKAIKDIATSILDKISEHLQNGEDIRIIGFASFRVRKKKGERIKVFDFATGQIKEITLKRNIVTARISKKAR
ncbi:MULTISPECIES: HU family DNA-binding protein [unclassified Nitratiruptor]|uniref:HU family DNA-binding protein n=1 Tax=unclassified Nitratiruptor TaxID=2624044 RepID=UPI001915815F|nr:MULTISPECIES: HU family DNA-binding protein [unclassified Nitratiruptor]BCD59588.1 DNA-binding protein HU-beta [Nitratiruptor sp. YY08-10]BCD63512.1 DNA-binding protein HU-beta [Nitratiruptor sp. YY08-14]BCD83064.1 DNA-binding protein HU-beta [Nitratiruptor phage NrS-2]BCD83130.1 DNA-binding protein HU-beta [Nitratiruptor phage NrS-3]